MRTHKFDYTISRDANNSVFKDACRKIERLLPQAVKKDLLIDVDGSLYQVFKIGDKEIQVSNDYLVGAVYVESDVNLDELF